MICATAALGSSVLISFMTRSSQLRGQQAS
jgi:hypothetical protein